MDVAGRTRPRRWLANLGIGGDITYPESEMPATVTAVPWLAIGLCAYLLLLWVVVHSAALWYADPDDPLGALVRRRSLGGLLAAPGPAWMLGAPWWGDIPDGLLGQAVDCWTILLVLSAFAGIAVVLLAQWRLLICRISRFRPLSECCGPVTGSATATPKFDAGQSIFPLSAAASSARRTAADEILIANKNERQHRHG